MFRKSDSFLAPVKAETTPAGVYDLYPAFEIGEQIFDRIEALAERIAAHKCVVIDGYEGVLWDKFIGALTAALESLGRKVTCLPVSQALKPEAEIDSLIAPFMGDKDSIFGRMTDLLLIDFFDRAALKGLEPDAAADITLLYGCGAALAGWEAPLIYVDLPKNELQFRMAAGSAFNLGTMRRLDGRESYKRCYFIDWPILDGWKGSLIPRIDWIVDEQRIDAWTFMSGEALREGLRRMSRSSFRVRPWFAPGVWGGTTMASTPRSTSACAASPTSPASTAEPTSRVMPRSAAIVPSAATTAFEFASFGLWTTPSTSRPGTISWVASTTWGSGGRL